MKLEELKVYELAMNLGESCWRIISRWNNFERGSVGKQLVRAADSIAANIAEGYGRFHFKENIHFNFIARGSLFETKTWLVKAHNREMISTDELSALKTLMNELGLLLNGYIKSIGQRNIVLEAEEVYNTVNISLDKSARQSFLKPKELDELPFPND